MRHNVKRGGINQYNNDLHELHSSPSITCVTNLMNIGVADYVARMVRTKNTSKAFAEKLERRRACEVLRDVGGWKC
jgi:hypothetical protein